MKGETGIEKEPTPEEFEEVVEVLSCSLNPFIESAKETLVEFLNRTVGSIDTEMLLAAAKELEKKKEE